MLRNLARLLQAVLEEVVAGSAASVADDTAELDTSEVEVNTSIYVCTQFFQRNTQPSENFYACTASFCLPVSGAAHISAFQAHISRVLVNERCLNRVRLK